jgi:transposase InsO family protein
MSGDVHVRFCESAGVQFPRATHHLHAYESVSEARRSIGKYITFYNSLRPHSSLGGRTPDAAYFSSPAVEAA